MQKIPFVVEESVHNSRSVSTNQGEFKEARMGGEILQTTHGPASKEVTTP